MSDLRSQTVLLEESFDDGNLTERPLWSRFYATEPIAVDSTISHSPHFSCRISTVSQLSAIETSTRIFSSTLPFEIMEYVYVESMGDEAIPFLLRGQNTVLVLFLLPNGLVQLDVLKETAQWNTAQLRVPGGYGFRKWHSFKVVFDGSNETSLYIDGVLRGSIQQQLVDIPHTLQIGNRYLPHTSTFYVDDLLVTTSERLPSPGKIYLVLCSDTGTWDGLDVYRRTNYLRFGVFASPTGNASRVINREFRERMRDSYGEPMVFTWFMLDGSLIATNTNPEVQFPWISNLEMMRKYHEADLKTVGDELSLHYHDWIWNDPDRDGVFHWNQSLEFMEYRDDFIETIGHYVIEGRLLPTSFRSGWHYMDNEWESCLDSLIPYRFENASPLRAVDTVEPIDNNYDWSRASLEWAPYHPSASDYQAKGNLKGWETRCVYMKRLTLDWMLEAFSRAFRGEDQLMTIWSHLPETDFPEQIMGVDSVVRLARSFFPEVNYDYTTATEAMKKWRGSRDEKPPEIHCATQMNADTMNITIEMSEPLWQVTPLVFGKDATGRVVRLAPRSIAANTWSVAIDTRSTQFQAIGIAGTDTAGNSAVQVLDLIPTGVAKKEGGADNRYMLYPAYPNPFSTAGESAFGGNPATTIEFQVPKAGPVRLVVYNVLGEEVALLVNEALSAGRYKVNFNPVGLASGVYFPVLYVEGGVLRGKMLLTK